MLMRRWTPPSPVPVTSLDDQKTSQGHRPCLRRCKLIIYVFVALVLLGFCIAYTLQQERFFNDGYRRQQQDLFDRQQQLALDAYIEDVSSVLLKTPDIDQNSLDYIRTKTLLLLKSLETKRKKEILLFLHERNLVSNPQLNLHGADFTRMEFICPSTLRRLYLPGILWSHAVLVDCRLTSANFDHANLANARFVNCTLQHTSLIETNLDHSHFVHSLLINSDLHGASLIGANFLGAEVVQGNNFSEADLYQAQLTADQWNGKKISTVKHDFYRARLANGSFAGLLPAQNLLINGDAEMECSAPVQTMWTTANHNMTLSAEPIENTTGWGNCSFMVNASIRVYQHVQLHAYKLLIDTSNAAVSFAAFASCEGSYLEMHMFRADNLLHQWKSYKNAIERVDSINNSSMRQYGEDRYVLPRGTRNLTIYFGVQTLPSDSRCYFDNITLLISQTAMN